MDLELEELRGACHPVVELHTGAAPHRMDWELLVPGPPLAAGQNSSFHTRKMLVAVPPVGERPVEALLGSHCQTYRMDST